MTENLLVGALMTAFCIAAQCVVVSIVLRLLAHSTVNFATLGYGDIVMSKDRRLLGGLEAVNGVLMLGLTASIMFSVLQLLLKREMGRSGRRD